MRTSERSAFETRVRSFSDKIMEATGLTLGKMLDYDEGIGKFSSHHGTARDRMYVCAEFQSIATIPPGVFDLRYDLDMQQTIRISDEEALIIWDT